MPNNNEKESPLKAIPPQLIMPLAKGAIGGVTGGMSAGMGELQQIKEEFKEKDFKNQKFGKKLGMLAKAGLRGFGAYQQGMLSGVSQGLLGTDFGLGQQGLLADNQQGVQGPQEQQTTYSTNMMKIPMTMNNKPLKMLTGVKSPMTYKMSAAQYKSAVKMSEISGAAPLQSNAFYASLNAAKEKGANTFEVGGKTFNVK